MTEQFDAEVVIRHARYADERTGFAVLDGVARDGQPVVLVGPLSHLEERERVQISGVWVNDSRFGPQVKVSQALPLAPDDAEAVLAYLQRVRHVGARRAAMLIDRYGVAEVLAAIDADTRGALAAVGLRGGRAEEAAEAWNELRVTRALHLILAPHGLAYLVARVHDEYGSSAHQIVIRRPYELTSVFGVGFAIADRIAHATGAAADLEQRARAGALHLLAEAERGGNTCQPAPALMRELAELLDGPVPSGLMETLSHSGDVVLAGEWAYRRATAELEAELAERVQALVNASPAPWTTAEDRSGPADERAEDGGHAPTAEQRAGLENALAHRLSVITGGPGTGKTASIRTIAGTAARGGARVLLVAPTGRAAIRMSEASGVNARTVHSALGWVPGEGPLHGEDDPLSCELLILDESSMANLELLVMLLRAVGESTHVVLVGDADQLAPVGAGKPFAELVESSAVPVVRLTHIFRQAAGSMIVQGAHAIRRGELPSFTAGEGMRRDLFMVACADPRQALREVVSLVSERLSAHYEIDPVSDIQVFAPVYRGELGIDALNRALRHALNPHGQPLRGGRLRIGDKLMMTGRNLHELGLMNGTLLRLLDETTGDQDEPALLLASEESVFRLAPEQADRLQLAYACSVHRGQGIELPVAVIIAHPAAGAFFLRREMLYTSVTRARLATVIVGTPEVVARAARTPDTGRRHSRLADRLLEAA